MIGIILSLFSILFISGTLSPVFPFYDIFRFNIKVEEIPGTRILISLYDSDPDKEDDSLGEVVIQLQEDDFFNRIVTKWFPVQPKVKDVTFSSSVNEPIHFESLVERLHFLCFWIVGNDTVKYRRLQYRWHWTA